MLCFIPPFNYPQLSGSMKDNYHSFMEKLEQEINILLQNIDAILVSESDFFKLKELGYIGNDLSKFKIEKEFKDGSM